MVVVFNRFYGLCDCTFLLLYGNLMVMEIRNVAVGIAL